MSTKLEVAAALLARELTNPLGAVNTIAVRQGKKGIIRVLIDPTQERFVRSVPQRFRGYAVIVEQRSSTTTQDFYGDGGGRFVAGEPPT